MKKLVEEDMKRWEKEWRKNGEMKISERKEKDEEREIGRKDVEGKC